MGELTRVAFVVGAFAVAGAGVVGVVWLVHEPYAQAAKLACLTDRPAQGPHPGMVWVPAGTFEMGDTVYPEEGPRRTVSVAGFWIDRHEVTNAEFAAFVRATNYVTVAERPGPDHAPPGAAVFVPPKDGEQISSGTPWWRYVKGADWRHPGGPQTSIQGREHFPVVNLAYDDITAYTKWKGRALPSEAQWEWAARAGNTHANDHEQPKQANTWQGVFPKIDTGEDGFTGIAPVGCYEPNAFGLYDMMGNVWEWTTDAYDDRTPKARVIKGGSYLCSPDYCMRYRAGARQRQEETLGTSHVGFRTVLPGA